MRGRKIRRKAEDIRREHEIRIKEKEEQRED